MKRLIVLAVSLLWCLGLAAPAYAELGGGGWTFPKKWPNGVSRDYCIEPDAPANMGAPSYTNFRQSVVDAVNSEWEGRTNLNVNFNLQANECATNLDFDVYADAVVPCAMVALYEDSHGVQLTSRVSYQPMDQNALGDTIKCDRDNNGNLDFFWVSFDKADANFSWHFAHDDAVPMGEYQFVGVFTHEFGHALGMTGHFSEAGAACPSDSTYQTMCPGGFLGASQRTASHCGCYLQTLGNNYDRVVFNDIYP